MCPGGGAPDCCDACGARTTIYLPWWKKVPEWWTRRTERWWRRRDPWLCRACLDDVTREPVLSEDEKRRLLRELAEGAL